MSFNGTHFRNAQKPMIDMLINDLGATIFRLDPYGLSNWEVVNDNNDPNDMNWGATAPSAMARTTNAATTAR